MKALLLTAAREHLESTTELVKSSKGLLDPSDQERLLQLLKEAAERLDDPVTLPDREGRINRLVRTSGGVSWVVGYQKVSATTPVRLSQPTEED